MLSNFFFFLSFFFVRAGHAIICIFDEKSQNYRRRIYKVQKKKILIFSTLYMYFKIK